MVVRRPGVDFYPLRGRILPRCRGPWPFCSLQLSCEKWGYVGGGRHFYGVDFLHTYDFVSACPAATFFGADLFEMPLIGGNVSPRRDIEEEAESASVFISVAISNRPSLFSVVSVVAGDCGRDGTYALRVLKLLDN